MSIPRTLLASWALLGLVGCASYDKALMEDGGTADGGDENDQAPLELRLDVYPSDASPTLLPQSVLLDLQDDWSGLYVDVAPAVELSGTVLGFVATPYLVDPTVPGDDDQPIAARIDVRTDDGIGGGSAVSDADGSFRISVPPGRDYRLEILPEETDQVPFSVDTIPVLASDLDLGTVYLDYGAPVWGQVSFSNGATPIGAQVHLVDDDSGVEGPATVIDSEGWYLLRAYPGDYTVVVEGREGAGVPTIKRPLSFEDSTGAQVDLDVGPPDRVDVGGYLVDSRGNALVSGDVDWRYSLRWTAIDLRDVDGTLVVEDYTGSGGRFDVNLAAGEWRVEIIPPYGSGLSPRTLLVEVDDQDMNLGDLVLEDAQVLQALVRDPRGNAAADVLVVAQELAYDGYTYSTVTGADGTFRLELPLTEVELTLTPANPGEAAITRTSFDFEASSPDAFELAEGVLVSGVLESEGAPVSFALVEVRDSEGALYATALSDADGAFSMRVDSEPSAVEP